MSANPKKYYWLKLFDNFFRDPKIKKLKTLAGGDTYVVILLKFMLHTIKNNGVYEFEGILEKTLEKELELVLDEKEEHISVVLMFLQQVGLMVEVEKNQFQLTQVPLMLGGETAAAERKRNQREREKNKSLPPPKKGTSINKSVTMSQPVTKSHTEIEKEIEKDISFSLSLFINKPFITFGFNFDLNQMIAKRGTITSFQKSKADDKYVIWFENEEEREEELRLDANNLKLVFAKNEQGVYVNFEGVNLQNTKYSKLL